MQGFIVASGRQVQSICQLSVQRDFCQAIYSRPIFVRTQSTIHDPRNVSFNSRAFAAICANKTTIDEKDLFAKYSTGNV